MSIIPGDIVRVRETYTGPTVVDAQILADVDAFVVVHIVPGERVGDRNLPPLAGLRARDDAESERPIAVPLDLLDVVGHLDRVEGWRELEPGHWQRTAEAESSETLRRLTEPLGAVASHITAERTKLAAQTGRRQLIRREQWGSSYDYSSLTNRAVVHPANRVFIHISVTNPDSFATEAAHIRHIEAIGRSRFPATGISYNRLTTPSARGYEGQPILRRGAHTVNDKGLTWCNTTGCPSKGKTVTSPGHGTNLNYNARAYVYAANIDDPVSDAVIVEIAQQIAADIRAGYVAVGSPIHGHRCVAWKDCPGGRCFARLDDIVKLVNHYVSAGFGVAEEDDDMPTPAELWSYKVPDPHDNVPETVANLLRYARIDAYKALVEAQALTKLVVADSSNDITQEDLDAAKAEILAAVNTEQPEPTPPPLA